MTCILIMKHTWCVLFLCAICACQNENPLISSPLGYIRGSVMRTRTNRTIYAFRGIRYAQPPVGNLRFRPPIAVEKWTHIYNATTDGPVCPQPSDDPVSEDCLLLNVYTTRLPAANGSAESKRPVIVYLHAGGFYSVTGRSDWAGPQYFLDQNIVLVTLNYRLGSLGFISAGVGAPGNNGLKDQVVALRWIQTNIESFGGDPDSVTLLGYSAGAWSITLHLVSPMSRGLFHRAIISSGSILGQWKIGNDQEELARKQAKLVGCPASDVNRMLQCLRSVPAEVLGGSLPEFAEFGYDPVLIWTPVVEENYGQERFLTDDPLRSIERGDFMQVPLVIGLTKDEFANRAFQIVENHTLLNELGEHFETYAPISFLYERNSDGSKAISGALRKFYFRDDLSLPGLAKLYADSIIGFAVSRTANLISKKSSQPIYFYEFTYQGRFSHFYIPGSNGTIPYGVVHHDDLIYLFYISTLFPYFDDEFPETEMVKTLTSLWATFADSGHPTLDGKKHVSWTPYNIVNKTYLEIGDNLILKQRLYEERYEFWDSLFPSDRNQSKTLFIIQK